MQNKFNLYIVQHLSIVNTELVKLTSYLQKNTSFKIFFVNSSSPQPEINKKQINLFFSDRFVPQISGKEFVELLTEITDSEEIDWDVFLLGKCTKDNVKRNVQFVEYDYYTQPLLFNKNVEPTFDASVFLDRINSNQINIFCLDNNIVTVLNNSDYSINNNNINNTESNNNSVPSEDVNIIKNNTNNNTWWYVGGVILIAVIVYYYYSNYSKNKSIVNNKSESKEVNKTTVTATNNTAPNSTKL